MALINILNDIGNAVREKTDGTELIPLKEMAGAISGISSVPNPLEYAKRLDYAFQYSVFPKGYELELDVSYVTSLEGMLHNASGIIKLILKGNTNGSAASFLQFMRGCNSIVEVDFTNFIVKPSNAQLMFSGAKNIKTIKGEIDLTECTNVANAFTNCGSLEEIRFKQNSIGLSISFKNSAHLSTTSVQSIIDGLATVETAQTLTLHSSIVLTDEQKAQISSKNWTLVQ